PRRSSAALRAGRDRARVRRRRRRRAARTAPAQAAAAGPMSPDGARRARKTAPPSTPATGRTRRSDGRAAQRVIPTDVDTVDVRVGTRTVHLTNLRKPFWPERGITKGDLLQYYVDVSTALLPHLRDRAMVMKRYPNGAAGDFFFMKRAPTPRPAWIETCTIDHGSGNVIDFPMIQDLASLVWVVNLGCIDLNQWYGRCDAQDRPDY